jgi:hypothetical protein
MCGAGEAVPIATGAIAWDIGIAGANITGGFGAGLIMTTFA